MLTATKNFKSSVNIKFDLENIDFLKKYMPTPSHAEALHGVLNGFNDTSNRRSHIVIGPYGTGKSLLGTLLAATVSKNINNRDFNVIRKKFASVDDDIHDELIKIRSKEKRYLPVVLNGYEGNFKNSILTAIQKTLAQNGIGIIVPGVMFKILQTVDNWKENYPKTYKNFKSYLRERGKHIDVWRLEVQSQNFNEINWFKSIFPSLTSGTEFLVDFSGDFIEQIKFIIDELKLLDIGLFVVYDEFGRFLQSLEHNEVNETMQNLQDLAELADHYTVDLHLLFITHKHLRHYFSSFNQELQNEFQRIEKRFKLYYIDSDSSTFFRIAQTAISNLYDINKSLFNVTEITNQLRKYPLFPELNQVEVENLIVRGTYPIHPVTLFLLPQLSSLYGQNERTLFTFMESKESNSLYKHLTGKNNYYLPNQLFSYFFPNFFDVDFEEKDKIASLYKGIITKIPEISYPTKIGIQLLDIIKFITLWELCGLQSKVKLSTDFIAFALNVSEVDISEELKVLQSLKAIRYNRILGYWELFEGSNYNIDELVAERSEQLKIDKEKILSIFEESLTKKYFLARKYNDEKSMTRFAAVNILFSSDILLDKHDPNSILSKKNTDSLINLIILESQNDRDDIIQKIISKNDQLSFYCIHPYALETIYDSISKQYIIRNLINDEVLLNSDKNLKKELHLHLENIKHDVNKFIKIFLDFSSELTWFRNIRKIKIDNEIILEEQLSQLMFGLYPDTPEVRNDGFNRRKLNNMQLKAGYKVVNQLLTKPYIQNLGIEGNGPEYLIYASIFKNNNLRLNELDNIKSPELNRLRVKLLKLLNEKNSGSFQDLISIFTKKPFGIRQPLIPILLVALIRDKWDQILFYNNEMFISQLNGEIIFSMVQEPEKYNYVFLRLNDEFNQFLSIMEQIFSDYIDTGNIQTIKPILVSQAILKWLRSLPRFVQITRNLDDELVKFKDEIRTSEIDPQKGLTLLYERFKYSPVNLEKFVRRLNNEYSSFKSELVNELFNTVGVKDLIELQTWIKQQNPIFYKENNLLRSLNLHLESEDWIERITSDIVGVELSNWSDKTKEMFLVQVKNNVSKLEEENTSDNNSIVINFNNKRKIIKKAELSTKSITLHQNVTRILKNGGRNVPKEEVENIVLLLLEEFVE
ncbi:hypothetical protein QNH39_12400 [Neobacillus novalis]|uniref:ATP-binding protein n=1 Tax=Neobacillus novalis TaxID=220687 RepID=A0AA95SJC9_9BACI|nr:hypothetical protein [Neobacillus novalis]WHY88586.1 hypothetical protein QNH39_12400 [Neobacillus novalis]